MEKIKIGVVGIGSLGEMHVANVQNKVQDAEVVAVCARHADRVEEIQKKYNIPNGYTSYDEMLEIATQERNEDARPELKGMVENLEDYDTVFLGYPIWWGGLPMPVYTFLEGGDFSGKTIYPFNTHGGSGVAGTDREVAAIVPDADVRDGFAVSGKTAQNDPQKTEELVKEYLQGLTLSEE